MTFLQHYSNKCHVVRKTICQSTLPKNGIIHRRPTPILLPSKAPHPHRIVPSSFFHTSSHLYKSTTTTTSNANLNRVVVVKKSLPVDRSMAATVAATAAKSSVVVPPTRQQLNTLFISSAIPMVGFGFMDNFIMIQAGGLIDSTICVKFGLATMTAAAMGQVVSDVSGVMFGGALEGFLTRVGLAPQSNLTAAQRQLTICRRVGMSGAVLGVIFGCALGATSLLLLDLERHDSSSSHEEVNDIMKVLSDVFALDAKHDLKSDFCTLYLVNKNRGFKNMEGKLIFKSVKDVEAKSHAAICLEKGTPVRDNLHRELKPNDVLRSIICVPVRSKKGELLGILEMKNKRADERGISHFTEHDEKMAHFLGDHVGIIFDQLISNES